jgi:RNA polymerase sigma-70 factor (ECF subfamily)
MEDDRLAAQLADLHPRSFAWAVICCSGDREEAAEVLQTTYLEIVEGRARHRGEASLQTWLFAVIRNRAASRHRRRRVAQRVMAVLGREARHASRPPQPDDLVASAQQAGRLRRELMGLAPRQREVLELVLDYEFSLRQAANVMGVSIGAARRHYARAKQALARTLAPEDCR